MRCVKVKNALRKKCVAHLLRNKCVEKQRRNREQEQEQYMLAFHERNVQKQMAALQSVAEHGGQILIEYGHRMFDAPAAVGMVHAVAAKAVAVDDGKVRHRREVCLLYTSPSPRD